jgi:D-alanine-D-alanine ligase
MSKLRVALLFGGRSDEHEISIMSARSILRNADLKKYELIPIAITKNGFWLSTDESKEILESQLFEVKDTKEVKTISESLKDFLSEKVDLVFPILHGPYGEDGKIQGLLEVLNIPYVGADVLSSSIGMDKTIMKKLFSYHHLPQSKFRVVYYREFEENFEGIYNEIDEKIFWPCFVKPANMGSSIGVYKVIEASKLKNFLEKAFAFDKKIIIEEYIKGREIECSVLGNYDIDVSLPGEIIPGHDFYDYSAKYQDKSTRLIIPAKLDNELVEEVRELAMKAFKAIDGRGFARVDFFIRNCDNKVFVNEINTIPGFTKYSMYPKLWEASGISYKKLIDILIELALEDKS